MSDTTAPAKPKRLSLITPVFRVSFPHVFTPQQPSDPAKKPKYGIMAVWTPGEFGPDEKERWAKMIESVNALSMKYFNKPIKDLPANIKRPFHRGDEKEKYGFTKEQIYCSPTSHIKPKVLAADARTEIIDVQAFYPGCYARASVSPFHYNKDGGIGIAFGLNNIMFVKDGARLDNRVDASEEFEEFANPDAAAVAGLTDDDLGF